MFHVDLVSVLQQQPTCATYSAKAIASVLHRNVCRNADPSVASCVLWHDSDKDECVDCGHDKGCEGREPPLPPSPPPHPARPPLSQYKRGIRKAEYFAYGSGIYTNAWGDAGAPFPLLIRGASWYVPMRRVHDLAFFAA